MLCIGSFDFAYRYSNIVNIMCNLMPPSEVGGKVPASSASMSTSNCAFKLIWVAMQCY